MEDKALATLRTFFERRKLETTTVAVRTELDRVNAYTIGSILVLFSQKDKGFQEKDVERFVAFAKDNSYTNGLVIVAMSKPSAAVLRLVKAYAKEHIQFFWIWHLQNDWTTHRYSMPHRILTQEEATALIKRYTLTNPSAQLPSIDSQDYQARVLGAVPGDILEIQRHSDVAGPAVYYRYCVEDVNVA
jgi:DNA-directed RNA polymerase I, II, and III subunit RPABC1